MLQGFLGGGGSGGSAGGWFNVSEYIGTLGLGAPTRDTAGQYVSMTSDASGTEIAVTGLAASGNPTPGYAGWDCGLFSAMAPGFPLDGTAYLEARMTTVTDATINQDMTLQFGFGTVATLAANYMVFGYWAGSGSGRGMSITYGVTRYTALHTSAAARRWTIAVSNNGLYPAMAGSGDPNGSTSMGHNGTIGMTRVGLFGGTRAAPGVPQTVKVLIEMRGVSWL